ncbi:MAG: type II toxin-antitoxin system RelE/ParE family toxin [Alphaproteobacteria bacterium]|nr:type II toxin-antitoxin system RelE/ParE family toxin [Alphaproteobacteria bacterium]
MFEVQETEVFRDWLASQRDLRARATIAARVKRLRNGNFGVARSLGGGLHELKVDYGPGYRVYFVNRGRVVVVVLCGGDKGSQVRDIERARFLARGF